VRYISAPLLLRLNGARWQHLTPVSSAPPYPTTHNLPEKHRQVCEGPRYAKCRFFEERENQRGQKQKTTAGGPPPRGDKTFIDG